MEGGVATCHLPGRARDKDGNLTPSHGSACVGVVPVRPLVDKSRLCREANRSVSRALYPHLHFAVHAILIYDK